VSLEFISALDRYTVTAATSINGLFATGATLMAWVRPDTAGITTTFGRILDKASWDFYCDNGTSTNSFSFDHKRATLDGSWSMPASTMQFNVWQHVCVTYDGSNTANNAVMYYNGVSQTVTRNSAPSGALVSDSANNLILGNTTAGDRTYDGQMEDLRFYNRILSANELATIFACRSHDGIRSGLVGRWLLPDEGAPAGAGLTTIPDHSGNGNTGAKTGTPLYRASNLEPRRREAS
jgi:hypothetical protein